MNLENYHIDEKNKKICLYWKYEEKNLLDYLNDRPNPDIDFFMNTTISLMKALWFAHQRNIAHRNLAPGKIFCSGSGAILIGDWGTAKILVRYGIWNRGSKVNEPGLYSAPELNKVTPGQCMDVFSCDVYSLGLTLLFCLGIRPSKLPFELNETSKENYDLFWN